MIDKIQLLSAGLAAFGLGAGALIPSPAFAIDSTPPGHFSYPPAPRLEPRLAPDPRKNQIVDSVQSTNSSSSASASSSVSVTGGKPGKCRAEASAHAKANDVEDSDHDLKVAKGDGCSAKASSSATVKPQRQQSE